MPKKRCLLSRRRHLDVKTVESLNKFDVLEDIKKRIITGFGIKAVEHKSDFHVRF